jgi:homoserine O-acetyltransferase
MDQKTASTSVGIVSYNDLELYNQTAPLRLESGFDLGPVSVRYETYGTLNKDKSNAILICHAFSGDAHAAGYHTSIHNDPGWWDIMIGPNKAFDTTKFFIICSNVIGGCMGSTGPGSINPKTEKPYALDFPVITIGDMVEVQKALIDRLGIQKLLAVAGGSMGGMQALEWSLRFPDMVFSSIVIASTGRLSAQGIAFNAVGRNAITSDPNWNQGQYYHQEVPAKGLAIARMVGHITYLSDKSMGMKFGRKLQSREQFGFDFQDQFQVESYLEYQGDKFVDRFDANSYIYLTKAMDYYDLAETYGSYEEAFANKDIKFLVISYSSDWLFPTYQSKELVYAMMRVGRDVSYTELESPYGHDAFLLEAHRQEVIVKSFLESAAREYC